MQIIFPCSDKAEQKFVIHGEVDIRICENKLDLIFKKFTARLKVVLPLISTRNLDISSLLDILNSLLLNLGSL